jgi:UDP-glucose 4-epimerase
MKALVTGGAGFIGHHLVRSLLERDAAVVVLDDFSTGFRERLAPFADRVRVVEASVTDARALDEASRGCEVIFHEAALASVERSFADPVLTNHINVSGTVEVVLAAARQQVRRVVFASSSAVYGVPDTLPCHEAMRPAPESPYGASKLAGEGYMHSLGTHLGVETVALRYFNVFGPGQDPTSDYAAVIPLFITALLDGRQPVINGDGDITRDFIYVEDVIAANLRAAVTADACGSTMNIASGQQTSLLGLLDAIAAATGSSADPSFGPPRAGDIKHSVADVSLARRLLGVEPRVPFAEGIRRTVEWYRSQRLDAHER